MPGEFESILTKLQGKLGKQTIRRASTINRPRPKFNVIQIKAINDFVKRNPKADGGSVNGSEQAAFRAKVEELMDDGYDFGEAVREAMRQGYDDGGKVRKIYKVIREITDVDRIQAANKGNPIPKDAKFKIQLPGSKMQGGKGGSSTTQMVYGKTKKELNEALKKSEKLTKSYVKPRLPKNDPNSPLYEPPVKKADKFLVKKSSEKIKENINKVVYEEVIGSKNYPETFKRTGKKVTKYKPFIGPNKVTIEGKGADTLKEAEKFVTDYFKKNPKQIRVRDPEKDYVSKDERRQTEKELQGRTIKFGAPKGYVAHHMLPLAGKVDVTDRDIAIISDKMNAELAQFDKPMNKLVKEAFALDFSQEGSLKRMDKINKELADIVKKAEKKLPKKYKGLIGFNKLTPVLGEFDSKGNQVFDVKPIGADYKKSIGQKKKGTPLRDIKTKAIRELVQRAEKMGNIYRSVRPNIDALTNIIPGRADNALAAAIDFPMMYISGAPLTQAAGSAASMFMNNPNLGKAINIGLEQAALSDEEKFLQRATQRREGIESALKSVPSKFQSFIEKNKGPADESFTSYFDGGIVSTLKGVK